MSDLITRIKEKKATVGIKTDVALGRKAGIKQQDISKILSGKIKNPSAGIILKLAQALETTSEYLLTGKPPAPAKPEPVAQKPHLVETLGVAGERAYGEDARLLRALTSFLRAWADGDEHHRNNLVDTIERLEKSIAISKRFTGS